MIKYNPKSWLGLIFHSHSRFIFKKLVPSQVFLTAYTLLVIYLVQDYLKLDIFSTIAVHSLLGIVLGLFLVFRTNSAYDRWWEGRKIWGNLVNDSRDLAFKLNSFLPSADEGNRKFYSTMIPNFVLALKEHLRTVPEHQELDLLSEGNNQSFLDAVNKPNFILNKLFIRTNQLKDDSLIDGFQFLVLEKGISGMVDSLGACERILNTPIPYSYSMFMKKFVFFYLITLPFAFMDEFGYWTVLLVLFVTYILMGTELIAEEIEDPFGRDENDLPTDFLAEKIKGDVELILTVKK